MFSIVIWRLCLAEASVGEVAAGRQGSGCVWLAGCWLLRDDDQLPIQLDQPTTSRGKSGGTKYPGSDEAKAAAAAQIS